MDVDQDNERHRREEQERRAKRKVRFLLLLKSCRGIEMIIYRGGGACHAAACLYS